MQSKALFNICNKKLHWCQLYMRCNKGPVFKPWRLGLSLVGYSPFHFFLSMYRVNFNEYFKNDCTEYMHSSLHSWFQCLGFGSMDPQDFDFLDPDPQKYADPRIRIQGVKYQAKTATKKTAKPQIWTFEKREIIKISLFLNGFRIKMSEKNIAKK